MPITLDGTTGITSPAIDLTTPLVVADGGTGSATLTAGSVVVGNGTSAVSLVAAGSNGNLLTSNGTTWTSAAAPAGGVTSLNGQTGAITNTDQYAIGSYVTGRPLNFTNYTNNTTIAGSSLYATSLSNGNFIVGTGPAFSAGSNSSLITTGTWRCLGAAYGNASTVGYAGLWVRIS
jgi:hypothetical protein